MENGQEPQWTIEDMAKRGVVAFEELEDAGADEWTKIEGALLVLQRAGVAELLHDRNDIAEENGKLEECLLFAVQGLLKAHESCATGATVFGQLAQALDIAISEFRNKVEQFGQEAEDGQVVAVQ